jgi:hypothetical protein
MGHQEGRHFSVPVNFSSTTTSIPLLFDKNQLFYGINIFTLLVNETPVAERLMFNDFKSLNSSDDIAAMALKNMSRDSIQLQLALPDFDKRANLSISVLPEKTISYIKNQNISTSFLLDPFVKGYIEDKTYYFSESDAKIKYNLDLLLLTQGWSKYNWNDIFSESPSLDNPRQNGLRQELYIQERIPNRIEHLLVWGSR